MLRIVIDTNVWIRILLRGPQTLPILIAWQADKFQLVTSQPLLDEFNTVWRRPRLLRAIQADQAEHLHRQMRYRGELVELVTTPPHCRDPKDQPFLATAIDGRADAIVSGDSDLRADDELRQAMAAFGVSLWGVETFMEAITP